MSTIAQIQADAGSHMLLVIGVIFVGAVWFFFPFLILSKCNKMIEISRELLKEMRELTSDADRSEKHLAAIRKYYEKPAGGDE